MRILVTGAAGFIGSHFVRHILAHHTDDEVLNLDALTYAGNLANLADLPEEQARRYRFVKGDVTDDALVAQLVDQAEAVVHFAAQTHVDRSIDDPQAFMRTNLWGAQTLLEAARRAWSGRQDRRLVLVSTDEVYGALELDDPRRFDEDWPLAPRSPYSASKAAADHLALAYYHTYGLPVMITRSCNNYGPNQFPEKLIPLMILNALAGRELPLYGDGRHVRDWIHVSDNCRAHDLVLRGGAPGRVYNVGADSQRSNLEVVRLVLALVAERAGRPPQEMMGLIKHVNDRPGHDRRYALDTSRLVQELGFAPRVNFKDGLADTIGWYVDNPEWCRAVTSGAYREYYQKMYDGR